LCELQNLKNYLHLENCDSLNDNTFITFRTRYEQKFVRLEDSDSKQKNRLKILKSTHAKSKKTQ